MEDSLSDANADLGHNLRLSRLLQTSPSISTSPGSSIRSSSAASIFERDIEPGHPIHSGYLGSREAADLSTAPALSGAVEAFVGGHPSDSIGVELAASNDCNVLNSPSQSFILPPPSPPSLDSQMGKLQSTQSIQSSILPASPPNSPPPSHQPQTPSPLNPHAQYSPRLASQNQSLVGSSSASPMPSNVHDSPASHRISLLSYGDVISERPTSAVPLQTAISHQHAPQSQLLTDDNDNQASPASNYVEERNRELERAALSKGLEARLETMSFPESAQISPLQQPSSRNASPVPHLPESSVPVVPSEERFIEEKETVTERGAERLSHRIQSLAN